MDSVNLEIWCSLSVLLMFLGLQMIEAGSVRTKNVSSVFMRGLASLTICIICSWLTGFMFTHSSGHYLLGHDTDYLILHNVTSVDRSRWLLYTSISSLPPAIMASSMSERTHITGHLIITAFTSIIVFPASAHWLWHPHGWLFKQGCYDLGGAIVVHLFSGFGAFVGALLVGPRVERLGDNFRDVTLPGHSLPLTAVGSVFVIIGMVGKLCGLAPTDQVTHAAVNTLVGGAGGGLVTMNMFKFKTRRGQKYSLNDTAATTSMALINRKWSFLVAFNGFLTGMISVCGTGADLPSWGAFISGIVAGLMFFLLSGLLRLNKIDDPVHGIGVNLSGGIVGAIVVGLCNLSKTHNGMMIGWQTVGVVAVAAWSSACFLIVLLPLLVCGKLRIKDCQEKSGIDAAKIKEPAYNISNASETGATSRRPPRAIPDVFLTPNPGVKHVNLSCQLSEINKRSHPRGSRYSLDIDEFSPRTVVELPSSACGWRLSQVPPPPPPYPTSTLKKQGSSLEVPEVTITSSNCCVSENDSEAPLLNSLSCSHSHVATLNVKQFKESIKEQKERLRQTNSVYATNKQSSVDIEENSSDNECEHEHVEIRDDNDLEENREVLNDFTKPLTGVSKAQGNLTNEEINETEIDITKYLKSPEPTQSTLTKTTNDGEGIDNPSCEVKTGGKKMFEQSIEFVSDEESDFDEKLI